ncbi:MAG: ribonuclease P protein component [Anaerolineae bacterium]|jgi:ribonuclease P protein component|nr:ribonuclease P protein component [Anaerolineae bacterium]
MGLPRPLRLARPEDFARVRQTGQTFRGRLMLVNAAPNGLSHNRYGLVTGKRLGGAVVRNRTRRLLREAIRHAHPALRPGWDIIVVPHPPLVGQPLTTIAHAFDSLARQAGLVELIEGGQP